jgi:hypothetical protein
MISVKKKQQYFPGGAECVVGLENAGKLYFRCGCPGPVCAPTEGRLVAPPLHLICPTRL